MDVSLKKILKSLSLELRHILEGAYDASGNWHPGDLERRLNEIGIWRDRDKPLDELPHLSTEDKAARKVVEAYLELRDEAGVQRGEAVAEFAQESAYTWANRLFALRCMETRNIIDEVILQKDAYGGRSLVHNRFAKKKPEACGGQDDGLFAVLFEEFAERSKELPGLFNPAAPAVALRPSVAALKKSIALLSGRETVRGEQAATDAVFESHDAFGWAYQYWNTEAKDRVFDKIRTEKGAKIEGADIIPATQLYTEPYMVKFLVQNSLGALWMGMHPESKLCEQWEYYVRDADRTLVEDKPVSELSMLDPALGSGHFHLEAFNLFYAMYEEEGILNTPEAIAASILNNNLFGIDIDERAIQIATAALWMKAKGKVPKLQPSDLTTFHDHLVATNIHLPKGKDHLEAFLKKHPEDAPLRSALETVFDGLENAHEIGSLLQIEEPVEKALRDERSKTSKVLKGEELFPVEQVNFEEWKRDVISRLKEHFHAEAQAADLATAFFGQTASKGMAMLDVLARRHDVVAANPPYMGWRTMGNVLQKYLKQHFPISHLDLCTAFLELSIRLLRKGGVSSFVLQKTVMYNFTLAGLRAFLLDNTKILAAGHLGTRAFSEVTGAKVDTVMLCLQYCSTSAVPGMSVFLRLTGDSPIEKEMSLRHLVHNGTNNRFRVDQNLFRQIPGFPFAYRLSKSEQRLLSNGIPGRSVFKVYAGISTADGSRFVRYSWETLRADVTRWWKCNEGGVAHRWLTNVPLRIDWKPDGIRIRSYEGSALRNLDKAGLPALTFSRMSGRDLGVRKLPKGFVSLDTGRTIHLHQGATISLDVLLTLLNSRYVRRLLRVLNDAFGATSEDLERIALPRLSKEHSDHLSKLAALLVSATQKEQENEVTSDHFEGFPIRDVGNGGLKQLAIRLISKKLAAQTVRVVASDESNRVIESALDFDGNDLKCVEEDAWVMGGRCQNLSNLNSQAEATIKGGYRADSNYERCQTPDLTNAQYIISQWSSNSSPEQVVAPSDAVDIDDPDEPNEKISPNEHPEGRLGSVSAKGGSSPLAILNSCVQSNLALLPSDLLDIHVADWFTMIVLRLLGHRWPKQIEENEPVPDWADKDGVIPLTDGTDEETLLERVRLRIAAEFPGGNVQSVENEFREIMGENLAKWFPGSFFARHISQFKKRPIAWQIESMPIRNHDEKARKKAAPTNAGPVFLCLFYYHKLDADLLPKLRTQYVGDLLTKYQTEQRTLEKLALKTDDQDTRKWQLQNWIDELKAFDDRLNEITAAGFATGSLRQCAIDDAMLQLKSRWLGKLRDACRPKPLKSWQELASQEKIHDDLPDWIAKAITRLPHHCSVVGPEPPDEKKFKDDSTSADLAAIICGKPHKLVREALTLMCDDWWKKCDQIVLAPIKQQIKETRERQAALEAELEQIDPPLTTIRKLEIAGELKSLKPLIKSLQGQIKGLTKSADKVRMKIVAWKCEDAEGWEKWLAKQPLYDQISALNSQKQPPKTVADWIAQESLYAPDINDGVRVNIAPIQKTGILAADVLAGKDLDKAIADRAEWRADERRWGREGKLPQPGWW